MILIMLFLLFSIGCDKLNYISVDMSKGKNHIGNSSNNGVTISNIQIINHQVVITGTQLDTVTQFKIQDQGTLINQLQIESQIPTKLIANTNGNVTFLAGKILDFIFTNTKAASSFTVNFSLCDSLLNGKGFNCSITPNDKEVLSYDAVSGLWKPRSVNGLSYQGAWDALNDPQPTGVSAGDYYIVSVASAPYQVGDWIVYNGTTYDRIDNSQSIVSVHGRTGVVVGLEGDYNLTKLSDVTITSPTNGQVLRFDGTNWVNSSISITESDPNVMAFAKSSLPSCLAGEVLKSNGTSFSCVTDNAGVDWASSGVQTIHSSRLNLTTASRVVTTDASGVLTPSSVTTTQLGYLSGVSSNIQSQIDSKISSETDPNVRAFAKAVLPTCGVGEVLKGDGTNLSCVVDQTGSSAFSGSANVVVMTDGAGALTSSGISSTVLGYLSGVTSSVQTQINGKQNTIDKTTVLDVSKLRVYGSNGTNYVELSTGALTANRILNFPDSNGSSGQILSTDGAGNLSWIASPSAPVTSINSQTGVVNLSTSDIGEGSNLYHTTARVLASAITAPTLTNSAIATSDSIQTALGKLQAQVNNKEGSLTAGTSSQYYRGDKTFQTLDTAAVAENTNLYFTDARARTASVADAITDAVTNIAPSQNAVFDGLALKLNSSSFIPWDQSGVQTIHASRLNLGAPSASKVIATDGSGFLVASSVTSTELGYLSGVTSSVQTQISSLSSAKADLTNSTQTITALSVTGLGAPSAASDAANKAYVDSVAGGGGSSALSSITAATASQTIDNLLNAITWDWSTATTQNAMNLSANGLTTGSLLRVTSSSASLNSTNGLLNVANTSASTTGVVARIQSNSTAASGLTVLANGRIGIGTTNPTLGLMQLVQSGMTETTGFTIHNSGATRQAQFYFDSNNHFNIDQHTTSSLLLAKDGGFVGIGNATPSRMLHVGSSSTATGTPVANFQNVDGTCTITPAASGSGIACSSDENLKENFQMIDGEKILSQLENLQAYTYNFKTAPDSSRRTGYKAQQIKKVAPEFVRENEDGFLQVYYDAFIPWLTEAIKTLSKKLSDFSRSLELKADKTEFKKLEEKLAEKDIEIQNLERRLQMLEKKLDKIDHK